MLSVTLIGYFCGGLFAIVLGGLGLFLIIHAQRSRRKALQSQSWPITKGTIIQAEFRAQEHDEKIHYVPIVRYTYQVNGTVYESRQITFGSSVEFNTQQNAVDYLAEYPIGSEVNVYYNAENPSDAVLKQAAQKTAVGMVIGIILLVIMFCLVCLMSTGIFRLVTAAG